jgi:hypothetical protein
VSLARRGPLSEADPARGGAKPSSKADLARGAFNPRARRTSPEGSFSLVALVGRRGHQGRDRGVCVCFGFVS